MKTLFESLGFDNDEMPESSLSENSLTDISGEDFCKRIVNSPEYRISLLSRIANGRLAPAVECRILEHAWGKVTDKLEVKQTSNDLEHLSAEKLEERALYLANLARNLRRNDTNEMNDDEPTDSESSIH